MKAIYCEDLVNKYCGNNWKIDDPNSGWGMAIVKCVLDGVNPTLDDVAQKLKVDRNIIIEAFKNLSLNGAFLENKIQSDKALKNGDYLAWCYYGGFASGATGPVLIHGC